MALPKTHTAALEHRRSAGEDVLAFAGGLLLGGVVGTVAAIALAPTDGATLRQRIADRFGDLLGDGFPSPGAAPSAPGPLAGDTAPNQAAGESDPNVAATGMASASGAAPAAPS